MNVIVRIYDGYACFFDDKREVRDGAEFYYVALSELESDISRQNWLQHMSEKRWFTPRVRDDLLAMLPA